MVSSTPWPHFIPGKDPVPIVQEAGWAPGPVWTGGKSRPHRDSIPTDALQCIKIALKTLILRLLNVSDASVDVTQILISKMQSIYIMVTQHKNSHMTFTT